MPGRPQASAVFFEPTTLADAAMHARPRGSSPPARTVIAERYELGERLGGGAHGVVWEARDRLTGDPVVVKVFARGPGALIHRELVALRLLRLPGVVPLLDEGIDGGVAFLVMERVAGTPFPTDARPWESIVDTTVTLLEILARAHAAGIVHRDLEPANVLVGESGEVTVLDFGISSSLHVAPEKARPAEASPATDLHAVGVMVFRALSGRSPHDSVSELADGRPRGPAAALEADGVPPRVAAMVARMLEREPEDRPHSAMEALRELRDEPAATGPALSGLPVGADGRCTEVALRALFAGEDRLFYLREDAARALFARTRGIPEHVAREIAAWERARLGRRTPDGLALDRDAIERLAAGLWAADPGVVPPRSTSPLARMVELVVTGAAAREIALEARSIALVLAKEGHPDEAAIALAEGAHAIRWGDVDDVAAMGDILAQWVEIALVGETPIALRRVLHEIRRAPARDARIANIEALARAGVAAFTASPSRAVELVDAVAPFEEIALERLRQGLRVEVAQYGREDAHERILSEVGRWVEGTGDPRTRSWLAFWQGRLAYREGRFEEAARLYFEATSEAAWTTERLTRMMHGAYALMQMSHHTRAAMWASAATALAARCRSPLAEARGALTMRCAGYRAGTITEPDLELVGAIGALGIPETEGQICFMEATIAWRAGRLAVARELAARARRVWSALGRPSGVLLADALALAAGTEMEPGEIDGLARDAGDLPIAVRVQVLALVAMGMRDRGMEAPRCSLLNELILEIPRERWTERIDALSVNEALAALAPAEATIPFAPDSSPDVRITVVRRRDRGQRTKR